MNKASLRPNIQAAMKRATANWFRWTGDRGFSLDSDPHSRREFPRGEARLVGRDRNRTSRLSDLLLRARVLRKLPRLYIPTEEETLLFMGFFFEPDEEEDDKRLKTEATN